jgi:hypothetical protein
LGTPNRSRESDEGEYRDRDSGATVFQVSEWTEGREARGGGACAGPLRGIL